MSGDFWDHALNALGAVLKVNEQRNAQAMAQREAKRQQAKPRRVRQQPEAPEPSRPALAGDDPGCCVTKRKVRL